MKQSSDRTEERILVGTRVVGPQPDSSTQRAPASVVRVHVLEFEAGFFEVRREGDVAEGAQLVALRSPLGRDRLLDTAQDNVARDRIEFHVAAGRQERKAALDLTLDLASACRRGGRGVVGRIGTRGDGCRRSRGRCRAPCPRARRRPRPSCCRNSVGLSVGRSSSSVSTCGTSTPSLNRSTVKTTLMRPASRSRSAAVRSFMGLSPHTATAAIPAARNCSAMKRACAIETQKPRALTPWGSPVFSRELLNDPPGPGMIGGEDVGQRGEVVAGTALPRHFGQVGSVVHAEVRERNQILLVDRVPHAEFGRDPSVEVAKDVEAVGALGRRGHPQQLSRRRCAPEASGTTVPPRDGTRRR